MTERKADPRFGVLLLGNPGHGHSLPIAPSRKGLGEGTNQLDNSISAQSSWGFPSIGIGFCTIKATCQATWTLKLPDSKWAIATQTIGW